MENKFLGAKACNKINYAIQAVNLAIIRNKKPGKFPMDVHINTTWGRHSWDTIISARRHDFSEYRPGICLGKFWILRDFVDKFKCCVTGLQVL